MFHNSSKEISSASAVSISRDSARAATSRMPWKHARLLVAFLMSTSVLACPEAASAKPTFTIFDAPGGIYGTFAEAISGAGVTGYYEDSSSIHGFWRTPDGSTTEFDPIGSTSTYALAINSSGEIVGSFNGNGVSVGFVRYPDGTITNLPTGDHPTGINDKGYIVGSDSVGRGFVMNPRGKIKAFHAHKSDRTAAKAIDADGNITGVYYDSANLQHGFERLANGDITTFDVRRAVQTTASSIANGAITGTYEDAGGVTHSFVRSANGEIVTFDAPKSTSTTAATIDENGYVTGYYQDASSINHGFIRSPQGRLTSFDVPNDADGTTATGIDSSEAITGIWVDSGELVHGFIRTN